MTWAIVRFAFAALLVCLSHGVADAQDVGTPWERCLKAPVRACVLDEALDLALSINAKGSVRACCATSPRRGQKVAISTKRRELRY